MSAVGYTKARSMGPVANAVERAGGSIARVFRRAETPLRVVEHPDQLMLLRDQLALVEFAAREIGDETLPLGLSLGAGIASLGAFGDHVAAAPDLGEAIGRTDAGIEKALQSATHMCLAPSGDLAKWTYEVSNSATIGRQKNELLAFGYMIGVLRNYLGPNASPSRAELPGDLAERARLEDMLGCDIARGEKAALFFPISALRAENPGRRDAAAPRVELPDPSDFGAGVEHLIGLALLERRPSLDWVARRLGLSPRGLQRKLMAKGARFEDIRRRVLIARAETLLRTPGCSIAQVSLELGYTDCAHFARAAVEWVGMPPREWRRQLGG